MREKARFPENFRNSKIWTTPADQSRLTHACTTVSGETSSQNFWSRRYSIALKRHKSRCQRHSAIRGQFFFLNRLYAVPPIPQPASTGATGVPATSPPTERHSDGTSHAPQQQVFRSASLCRRQAPCNSLTSSRCHFTPFLHTYPWHRLYITFPASYPSHFAWHIVS